MNRCIGLIRLHHNLLDFLAEAFGPTASQLFRCERTQDRMAEGMNTMGLFSFSVRVWASFEVLSAVRFSDIRK